MSALSEEERQRRNQLMVRLERAVTDAESIVANLRRQYDDVCHMWMLGSQYLDTAQALAAQEEGPSLCQQ